MKRYFVSVKTHINIERIFGNFYTFLSGAQKLIFPQIVSFTSKLPIKDFYLAMELKCQAPNY